MNMNFIQVGLENEQKQATFCPEVVMKCVEQLYLNEKTIDLVALLEQVDAEFAPEIFDILDTLVEMGKLDFDLVGNDSSPIQPVYKKIG